MGKTKQSHDKIACRLSQIIIKFNSGERVTIDELSAEFNVDKRTVQRDLHERLACLPIKKEGGYYSVEQYALGKLNFDDVKAFAAVSGAKRLYPSLSNNFITDVLNTKTDPAYLVKNYGFENLEGRVGDFEILSVAILGQAKVDFKYNRKDRTVNPYKLVNNNGIWYLAGDENGVLKNYSFAKMLNIKTSDETFAPNKDFVALIKKNELGWFSQNTLEVTLQIDASVAEYFLRRRIFPNQTIIKQTNEHLTLSTKASYEAEILGSVKYWLPHIKILTPAHLQEKLNEILSDYLKKKNNKI